MTEEQEEELSEAGPSDIQHDVLFCGDPEQEDNYEEESARVFEAFKTLAPRDSATKLREDIVRLEPSFYDTFAP